MATPSTQSLIYYPAGSPDELLLVDYGDTLLDAIAEEATVNVQPVNAINAAWMRFILRGGASIKLTVTVLTLHAHRAAAERYQDDVRDQMLMHPVGRVRQMKAYEDNQPTRITDWHATITVTPLPWDADQMVLADNTACAAMRYDITLTNPIPQ